MRQLAADNADDADNTMGGADESEGRRVTGLPWLQRLSARSAETACLSLQEAMT